MSTRVAGGAARPPVILYFHPKDGSAGVCAAWCDLRDRAAEVADAGDLVVGVSADDESSYAAFRFAHDLPQTLLMDDGAQ